MNRKISIRITNPYFKEAYGYELPKRPLDNHWVTQKYGYEAFLCGNEAIRMIYIKVDDWNLYAGSPEFFDDTIEATGYFDEIARQHVMIKAHLS